MRQRRLIKIASPLLLGSMLLAACGGEDNTGDGAKKTVKIGLIAPLSGDLSALGLGMKNSAELAIRQANKAEKVKGYTLVLDAQDDQAKADVGAQAASKLSSDPAVAAVIGTLNSSVAQQVQPILNRADITMVSPANTNPTLTQGDKPTKVRPYASYFRVATTDAIQGPFAANFVFNDVKAKKVVVIHDKKTYGQGLSEAFKKQFTTLGGTVAATETVNADDKNFSAVLSKIKGHNADLIYYGGEYPACSLLSKQAKGQGIKVPVMGGDGIFSGQYLTQGGNEVTGDFATSVGAPVEQLSTAKQFVTDYAAEKFAEPYEAYGAYAYDSANVIIEALAKTIATNGKDVAASRKDIVTAVGSTDLAGVTGKVTFDEFGDTTTKILTVYKAAKGADGKLAWTPEKVDEFK